MPNLDDVLKKINRQMGQKLKGNEKEVAKMYARQLAVLRKVLADRYEKFEIDGKLTYEEMAKFDRLNKLIKEIKDYLLLHYNELFKLISKILGNVYEDGFYLTANAIENETSQFLKYSVVTSEQVIAAINNPISGLTLNDRLERNRVNIIYTIQQEVTQGLVKGETYKQMSDRLKGALENDAVKSMRIVRTEGHRVQESSKLDAASHADKQGVIMMKEWNTLEDERVRRGVSNHAKLNNKKIPVAELFDDGLSKGPGPGLLGAAASDINCRCFLTYEVDRVEKAQFDPLNGMGFDEWKEKRLKKGR